MLQAYPIVGFGDYPAMSMVLQMKGHNGIFPCQMCLIEGLRILGHRSNAHYVPLKRSTHPDIVAKTTRRKVDEYDPANLPLRTPTQFLKHARLVQFAKRDTRAEELSMGCAIKGIPLLSCLPSLFFPTLFPFDFMHLIYENLIKNVVKLWTGTFKDLHHKDQDYYLAPSVWSAIGAATAQSGSTIPSAYKKADHTTADAWSFWALYLGPILLQRWFRNTDYYNHFVELVKLINLCLHFAVTKEHIQRIHIGFQEWVVEYER
ncbi:hypothetical protein FA13DRAFT_1752114 [Coprinellus micaceus]|uniref:Uncharacterized protein n=1 Tax=Coprinellus micaceus TaxID=71717 RepID=A0A4Y7TSM3_COPMI|nr:hypothetical protein FA13DRAFT_1752114 [Coprinellus micaceus]